MVKSRKFKTFILTTLFTVFFSSIIYAQGYYVERERTFSGGLVAGANFSQVQGDRFAGYHKLGFNGGGIVYAHFTKHIAASIEILFSQSGSRSTFNQISPSGKYYVEDYGISMNNVEVPIQIHYFDKRNSHLGLGLAPTRIVTAKEVAVTNDSAFNSSLNLEEDYPFNKFGLSAVLSGNLRLYKGLYLNVRYMQTLTPIRDNVHPEFGTGKQHSRTISLRVMYLFD